MQLITVTLDDKTSEALDRWLAKTAAATGPPPLTAEEAIPAMVRVCLGFTDITNLVASHIRAERAAEKLDAYQSRQGPRLFYLSTWQSRRATVSGPST